MLLLQHNKLLCQNKIIIPVKPYPGYNFRTGANLNGKFINDRGQFVFEKQKYSQFKIWDFPLEGNMSEKFILNEYTGELKSLKNESLKVLAAIDNKNQLNLIVDINFDNNFSNDTVLVYKYINYTRKEDLDNGIENFPYSKFIFYTKSREENINYFQLQPLAFYKKNITGWDYSEEKKLDISLSNTQYYAGNFEFKKSRYTLKSFTNKSFIKFMDDREFLEVYVTNDKYKNVDSQYASLAPLKLGDTIELQNKLFSLNFNHPTSAFILVYTGRPGKSGVIVGRTALDLQGFNEDSSLISLKSLTGNYVLLDFGFEGCGYCIEALPKLNELSKKYMPENLKMFSVIGTRTRKSFQNYLKKYSILNAVSIYDNKWRTKDGLSDRYKIGYFPTYILINKEGVICMREYGLDGLQKIENHLDGLFNK
jgi:thiol-disulfide isomerase/thioredoxin